MLTMHRSIPNHSGYYWFQGIVYYDGSLGGTVNIRALCKVDADLHLVLIDGKSYGEHDIQGQFYGLVPSPPWESEISVRSYFS